MKEHNKTYYSLEELKRARDCYEGYQDGEEVYYFVGALRYACDEIERLNNIINKAIEYLESYNTDFKNCRFGEAPISIRELGDLLDILKGVDKE